MRSYRTGDPCFWGRGRLGCTREPEGAPGPPARAAGRRSCCPVPVRRASPVSPRLSLGPARQNEPPSPSGRLPGWMADGWLWEWASGGPPSAAGFRASARRAGGGLLGQVLLGRKPLELAEFPGGRQCGAGASWEAGEVHRLAASGSSRAVGRWEGRGRRAAGASERWGGHGDRSCTAGKEGQWQSPAACGRRPGGAALEV